MKIIGLTSLRKFKALIRRFRSPITSTTGKLHDHGARLSGKSCLRPFSNKDGPQCACHEQMGNDFWFLPTGSCLYAPKAKPRTFPTCYICGKVDHADPFPASAIGCSRKDCL